MRFKRLKMAKAPATYQLNVHRYCYHQQIGSEVYWCMRNSGQGHSMELSDLLRVIGCGVTELRFGPQPVQFQTVPGRRRFLLPFHISNLYGKVSLWKAS